MEIKHFVFGKFRDQLPDFGIRVKSPLLTEEQAQSYAATISRLKQLCTLRANAQSYIEYIGQSQADSSVYFYTRVFPSGNNQDFGGAEMAGFSHAMVFSLQDLIELDFKPWVCRDRFVKVFDNEKIVGWDKIWFHREEIGSYSKDLKNISLSVEPNPTYNTPSHLQLANFEAGDSATQYILSINAYSTLEDLDGETLLRMFNMGIVLNYPVEYDQPKNVSGFAKFVMGKSSLTEEFRKKNWKNLTPMSIKSYVSSLSKKSTKLVEDDKDKGTIGQPEKKDTIIGTEKKDVPEIPQVLPPFVYPEVEKTGQNDELISSQKKIKQLKSQRIWFFIAIGIFAVGLGVLTWMVVKKAPETKALSDKQTTFPLPADTLVVKHLPKLERLKQGEQVTRAKYDSVFSAYQTAGHQVTEVQKLYGILNGNYKKLQDDNKHLLADVDSRTIQINKLSLQKDTLTHTLEVTKSELEKVKRENTISKEKINTLRDSLHNAVIIARQFKNDTAKVDTTVKAKPAVVSKDRKKKKGKG